MPRFVVLTHDHPFLHWDLMLEERGVLRTWRLLALPEARRTVPACPLGEHRIEYLEYEGPVSRGRGSVTRWDAGEYELLNATDAGLSLEFHGRRLTGRWALRPGLGEEWSFSAA
jgi:hypothetical protein